MLDVVVHKGMTGLKSTHKVGLKKSLYKMEELNLPISLPLVQCLNLRHDPMNREGGSST